MLVFAILLLVASIAAIALVVLGELGDGRPARRADRQVTDTSVRPPRPQEGWTPSRGGEPMPGSAAARARQGKP